MKKLITIIIVFQSILVQSASAGRIAYINPIISKAGTYGLAGLGMFKPTAIKFIYDNQGNKDANSSFEDDFYRKNRVNIPRYLFMKDIISNKLPEAYAGAHAHWGTIDRKFEDMASYMYQSVYPENYSDLLMYQQYKAQAREIEDFFNDLHYVIIKVAPKIFFQLYEKDPELVGHIISGISSGNYGLVNNLFKHLEDADLLNDFMVVLFAKLLGYEEWSELYFTVKNEKKKFKEAFFGSVPKTEETMRLESLFEFLKFEIINQGAESIVQLKERHQDLWKKLFQEKLSEIQSIDDLYQFLNTTEFKLKNMDKNSFQDLKKAVIDILLTKPRMNEQYFTDVDVNNLKIILWIIAAVTVLELTIKVKELFYAVASDYALFPTTRFKEQKSSQ